MGDDATSLAVAIGSFGKELTRTRFIPIE